MDKLDWSAKGATLKRHEQIQTSMAVIWQGAEDVQHTGGDNQGTGDVQHTAGDDQETGDDQHTGGNGEDNRHKTRKRGRYVLRDNLSMFYQPQQKKRRNNKPKNCFKNIVSLLYF